MMLVFGQWFDHLRIHPFKTDLTSVKGQIKDRVCESTDERFS